MEPSRGELPSGALVVELGARSLTLWRPDGETLSTWEQAVATTIASAASLVLTAAAAREAARQDTLTEALSAGALQDVLDAEIARAGRDGGALACVVLDLDSFKAFNDDLGHLTGDGLLRETARALRADLRPFDHVARRGGDEFAVVLPGVDATGLEAAAHRVHDSLTRRLHDSAPRTVTCSSGAVLWQSGEDGPALLDRAGEALREAKRAGGDRVQVTAMETGGRGDAAEPLSVDLRRALHGDGVRVLLQPICDLQDGGLAGFEALSRGPGRLERPDELLAAARRAGELVALDERLHREAFRAAEGQGLATPLSLFVNIEPETLVQLVSDDRFWRRTTRTFASFSEITERALLERPGPLLRACQRLRDLGWGVALDDVGHDLRALALLPLIAPDVIKLNRHLVQDGSSAQLAAVAVGLAGVAEAPDGRLLAEGIETDRHRERARAAGAELGQGWLFGRPEPRSPGSPT